MSGFNRPFGDTTVHRHECRSDFKAHIGETNEEPLGEATSESSRSLTAIFGNVTVAVSDAYFMVEPASAVIVSANSRLQTASGGAHDVTLIAGRGYQQACAALLKGHPDGLPQGSAWLTGDQGEQFTLTAGKRKVIQAITLRYFNSQRIRATPDIVYHAARSAFRVRDRR